MNATSNPVIGLATYLETITQIYEASAAARFLRSVEPFDLKDINDCLEKGRCSVKELTERFARLPGSDEFDALLLSADLNLLATGTLRNLCESCGLDSRGTGAALVARLNDSIVEMAEAVTELPADRNAFLLAATAADEARSSAARALSIGLRGFGPLMGKFAFRQVARLTVSLHYAARNGGIEAWLENSRADTAGTLVDLWRRISAHPQGRPLAGELDAAIRNTAAGHLRSILQKMGLPATGDRNELARRLAESLAGVSPSAAKTRSAAEPGTNEFSEIGRQARKAEQQYLALLQSVRTSPLEQIETEFAAFKSRPAAVILAFGKLRGYSEPSASRLLNRLWSNIELAAATAQRSDLRK